MEIKVFRLNPWTNIGVRGDGAWVIDEDQLTESKWRNKWVLLDWKHYEEEDYKQNRLLREIKQIIEAQDPIFEVTV